MRKNTICAVLTLSETSSSLQPIIQKRPIAALPFAGRFRIIDFMLSNLSQARIQSVSLFIGRSGKSIYDHIRSGRSWGFDSSIHGGVFTFSKQFLKYATSMETGFDETFYEDVIEFVTRSHSDYVFVSGSKVLANVNVTALQEAHIHSEKSITSVVDEKGKPMNMYLLKKDVFFDVVKEAVENQIFLETDDLLKVSLAKFDTHVFTHEGYVSFIDNVRAYYEANMDMLVRDKFVSLFNDKQPIATKDKNGAPTFYTQSSVVKNSLFATDCYVQGTVENSVIFRRVNVNDRAVVSHSVVMQGCTIEEGATVEYAILDKGVTVKAGATVRGTIDNIVVITANRVIEVEEN